MIQNTETKTLMIRQRASASLPISEKCVDQTWSASTMLLLHS